MITIQVMHLHGNVLKMDQVMHLHGDALKMEGPKHIARALVARNQINDVGAWACAQPDQRRRRVGARARRGAQGEPIIRRVHVVFFMKAHSVSKMHGVLDIRTRYRWWQCSSLAELYLLPRQLIAHLLAPHDRAFSHLSICLSICLSIHLSIHLSMPRPPRLSATSQDRPTLETVSSS